MEYEQALIIGKRRRSDAAMALAMHMKERAQEVCAVKPAKNAALDARDWEPVGEEILKEICLARGQFGDPEAYLVLVDGDGKAKACTHKSYPLSIAMQMASSIPLPVYAGRGGVLLEHIQAEATRKAQALAQLPDA